MLQFRAQTKPRYAPVGSSEDETRDMSVKTRSSGVRRRILYLCGLFLVASFILISQFFEASKIKTSNMHELFKLNQSKVNLENKCTCTFLDPVDVVFSYVNGTDPSWLKKKTSFNSDKPSKSYFENFLSLFINSVGDDNSANRYRDNEELRYALRSVVKHMCWTRNIYIVVAQQSQVPFWLNTSHPRINIITHSDIYKKGLPVFNSNSIEVHLSDIPGISDNFVYFNDDMMLGTDVYLEDFISQTYGQKVYFSWYMALRMLHMSRLFDWKYFDGWFKLRRTISHMPQFINRNIHLELRNSDAFKSEFDATSSNKFRTDEDITLTFSYFYYLIYENKPYILASKEEMRHVEFLALGKSSTVKAEKAKLDSLFQRKPKFVTINDEIGYGQKEADEVRDYLAYTYQRFFPEKAEFEF